MAIDQPSLYSQLAAAGIFNQGGPPVASITGGRIPLAFGLGDTSFNNLSIRTGWGDNPIGGMGQLGASFLNGGGYGRRPGAPSWLQAFVQSVFQDGARAREASHADLSNGSAQSLASIGAQIQLPNLSQVSFGGSDFIGNNLDSMTSGFVSGLPRIFRG